MLSGLFFPISTSQRGDVGALEEETFTGSLKVASADITAVFFAAAHGTAAEALNFLWKAFNTGCDVWVEYAPDGVAKGRTVNVGRALVADMSFTTSLDQVPEFSLSLEGSGPLVKAVYSGPGGNNAFDANPPVIILRPNA